MRLLGSTSTTHFVSFASIARCSKYQYTVPRILELKSTLDRCCQVLDFVFVIPTMYVSWESVHQRMRTRGNCRKKENNR